MSAPPAGPPEGLRSVVVIGTGLLGTSVGLALRAHGVDVRLVDHDPAVSVRAAELGAGTVGIEGLPRPADLAVVCVPPRHTAAVVVDVLAREVARTVTDVASVKARPLYEVAAAAVDSSRYVGGHPMAGRERSGPTAARADLFLGRPWVLTPTATTAPEAVADVRALVAVCGAVAVEMGAAEHDSAVALVSHAPQVVASLVAGRLLGASPVALGLCGQGVRDVTRIAASDPALWQGILERNAAPVTAVLRSLRADLDAVITGLETAPGADGSEAVLAALARGVEGRRAVPGKHGEQPRPYVVVPVVVTDRPGQLAALFAAAGAAEVNIEDVRMDHARGQPLGVVELLVDPGSVPRLAAGLRGRGFTVHD